MSFSPITITSGAFNGTTPGKYVKSTVGFNDPTNEIRIKGGSKTKTGNTTYSTGRILQHEDADGKKYTSTITVSVSQSPLCSIAEVDGALGDIDEFLDATSLNDIALGRS